MPATTRTQGRRNDGRPRTGRRDAGASPWDEDDDDELEDGLDDGFDNSSTVAGLEARFGSARAALAQVHSERVRETRKRRRLRAALEAAEGELADLRERLGIGADTELPEKPALVSADDVAELEGYRALGKLAEVKTKVNEHSELSQKAAEADAREARSRAAKLAGGWDADVLSDLLGLMELDLEFKTEKQDGKDVTVPYVRPRTEGAKSSRLTEFVENDEKAKKYVPALVAAQGAPQTRGGEEPAVGAGAARGFPLYAPRTTSASGAPERDPVATTLSGRDFRPSKLRADS